MHRTPTLLALAAALVAATSGCASSYAPRPGPRLSLVMDGGSYAYVREGKTYEGGMFGGDIEEAVQGNPQAEDYARSYKNGMVAGFVTTLLGAATAVGGAAFTGASVARSDSTTSGVPLGLAVIGAGLVTELVGVLITATAIPHLFDAVNAYNDGLGAGDPPPAPAAAR